MDKSDKNQMLNPKEVAEILGVHQKTVHLWLRTGKIEGIKISYRAWRISRSALLEFIERNKNIPKKDNLVDGNNKVVSSDSNPVQSTQEEEAKDVPHHTNMKHYIRDIMGETANKEK
jgi:excisionase family DNA binding protein